MTGWVKLAIAVGAVAAVAGAATFQVHRHRGVRPRVWTESIAAREVVTTIAATGTARWRRSITLSAPEDGRVQRVFVASGQAVRAGQLLLTLDDRLARLDEERRRGAVATAEAERRRAEAELDRLRAARDHSRRSHQRIVRLFAAATASAEAVARARHDARSAELEYLAGVRAAEAAGARRLGTSADWRAAELRRARLAIRAPTDGVVTAVFVQRGQPVHAGSAHVPPTRLLALGAAAVTDVEAAIDRGSAWRVWPGMRAVVAVPALLEEALAARVLSVAGESAHEGEGHAVVRVRLESPPTGLRPGMSARVTVIAASRVRVPAVPNHAVIGGADGAAGAWTIRQGAMALVPVVLGLRGDFYSEILAGLDVGALVVTGPDAVIRTLGLGDRIAAVPAPVRAP